MKEINDFFLNKILDELEKLNITLEEKKKEILNNKLKYYNPFWRLKLIKIDNVLSLFWCLKQIIITIKRNLYLNLENDDPILKKNLETLDDQINPYYPLYSYSEVFYELQSIIKII